MTRSAEPRHSPEYELLGRYDPRDGNRILKGLEEQHLSFEVQECSEIRLYWPRSLLCIYVRPEDKKKAEAISDQDSARSRVAAGHSLCGRWRQSSSSCAGDGDHILQPIHLTPMREVKCGKDVVSSYVLAELGFGLLERVLFGLRTGVSLPVVILLSVRERLCSQHYLINAIGVEEERGGGLNLMRRSRKRIGAG